MSPKTVKTTPEPNHKVKTYSHLIDAVDHLESALVHAGPQGARSWYRYAAVLGALQRTSDVLRDLSYDVESRSDDCTPNDDGF